MAPQPNLAMGMALESSVVLVNKKLSIASGALTVAGTHVGLKATRKLAISSGALTLTGTHVTLIYTELFSPLDIEGCVLWLDASQESFANNDPVGTWTDRSGNLNDAVQFTDGYRPIFKTNILGSMPGLLFDGSDDKLVTAGNVSVKTSIVLCKYTLSTFAGFSGAIGQASKIWITGHQGYTYLYNDEGPDHYYLDGGVMSEHAAVTNAWHTISSTDDIANNEPVIIGNDHGLSDAFHRFWTGYIHEGIAWNIELTSDQETTVYNYLKTKWGY